MLELILLIEMVLDDALVTAGDEDEMLDPGLARLIDRILDQRPVNDRQHFLGHGLGGRQEACAEPGNGKHRGAYTFEQGTVLQTIDYCKGLSTQPE